jgi:iron complex outermembrane recepter protein
MVPGMDVAEIDSDTWAISTRGFNEEFSNKLLVMVDGRSVYTPTFAGVFWETLDLPLEDIERIEVIRGPGGTAWGANAVNGVIDIITKKASETKGGFAVAGGGNLDQGFGALQYGSPLGNSTNYRVFAKYFDQAQLPNLAGQHGGDGWHVLRSGFRVDRVQSPRDDITLQGDLYGGREGQAVLTFGSGAATQSQASLGGGYFQTVWNRTYSTASSTALKISYDRYVRNLPFRDRRSTLDVDSAHENYSIRATKRSNDEIGLLFDQFNGMLARIEQRDAALQQAHDLLEKRVAERTSYLNALIENSPLAIMVLDADQKIQLCNPAFEKLFQYPRQETL